MTSKTAQRAQHWIVAGVYTALIYVFAWFVNPLWDRLTVVLGTESAGITINRAVPILGLVLLALLLIRFRLPRLSSYFWIGAVVAGYAYILTLHAEYPVERVHLIQYSLVAWVYFRPLRLDCRNRVSYTLAGGAVFLGHIREPVLTAEGIFDPGLDAIGGEPVGPLPPHLGAEAGAGTLQMPI